MNYRFIVRDLQAIGNAIENMTINEWFYGCYKLNKYEASVEWQLLLFFDLRKVRD